MGKVIYTDERVAEIRGLLETYIKETEIPIVAQFAYLNDIPRQTLYELEGLRDTIKKLIDKKESQLEELALTKQINPTMAIFSLKQLGWKDVQETPESHNEKISIEIIEDNKNTV